MAKWIGVRKNDETYVTSKYDDPDSVGAVPKIFVMDYIKDENPYMLRA